MTETMERTAGEKEVADPITDLKVIASKAGDLPPLPTVALQVMELTQNPDASTRDIQKVISTDQALTVKILKIVNSAMYALQREVSTVSHALAILGMETVRSIVLGASFQNLFKSVRGKDLETKLLSDHSWGAATAAKAVAAHIRYQNTEEAFLTGLIHDMGKVVLSKNRPREYSEIVNDVYAGRGRFVDAETALFGFSHAHVGAVLAAKWNFPQQLAEAILYHHDPISAPTHPRLASIVNMANLLMVQMEVGFEKDKSLDLSKQASAEYLELDQKAIEGILNDVRAKVGDGIPM